MFTLPLASTSSIQSILLLVTCVALMVCGCDRPSAEPAQLTVAAASDLMPAFEELGRNFEQQTGTKVVLSFGSTGMLAAQIANGAPMDLFAAANVSFVDQLEQKGLIVPGTKQLYARGRLTLWTRKDTPYKLGTINDLTRAEVKRIAIANPDHAPYGLAARQALETAGIWETLKPKLVYGENIRQTLQFAQTGNVDAAIVALSLSTGSEGDWILVPEEMHQPLDQAMAIIKGSKHKPEARSFANYINSPEGRVVMRKYGLTLAGED